MIPVEVRKIIVESRAKGITAKEIRKVTGVSISAISSAAIINLKWNCCNKNRLLKYINSLDQSLMQNVSLCQRSGDKYMIGFFLGSLFGGTVGLVATCLCVAAGRADNGIHSKDSE